MIVTMPKPFVPSGWWKSDESMLRMTYKWPSKEQYKKYGGYKLVLKPCPKAQLLRVQARAAKRACGSALQHVTHVLTERNQLKLPKNLARNGELGFVNTYFC